MNIDKPLAQRRILLVEDEPGLVLTLTDRLENEGYQVSSAGDGVTGLELAAGGGFDLVILDVMLPRKGGFDVCRQLRQTGNDVPVLMLTARGELVDKVVGLQIGGDDYLTKPFEMMELLARIEALLRRAGPRTSEEQVGGAVEFGNVRVDFRKGDVMRDGEPVTPVGTRVPVTAVSGRTARGAAVPG